MSYAEILKDSKQDKRPCSINVRLSEQELKELQKYADRYSGGIMSDFIRTFIFKIMPEVEKKGKK